MKNKKVLIIALAAVMSAIGLAGCGSKTEEDSKAQSRAETSAASESVTQEDEPAENTDVPEADITSDVPETDVTAEIPEELKTLFPFISDDGKALPTYVENVKAIDNSGNAKVTELCYDNIEAELDMGKLYPITFSQPGSLQEIDGFYAMEFNTESENYYVQLADSADTDIEEAEIYTPGVEEVTYFTYAYIENGDYILVPIIAGNDQSGYYFVRPVVRMLGCDTDALAVPESGKICVSNSQVNA